MQIEFLNDNGEPVQTIVWYNSDKVEETLSIVKDTYVFTDDVGRQSYFSPSSLTYIEQAIKRLKSVHGI